MISHQPTRIIYRRKILFLSGIVAGDPLQQLLSFSPTYDFPLPDPIPSFSLSPFVTELIDAILLFRTTFTIYNIYSLYSLFICIRSYSRRKILQR